MPFIVLLGCDGSGKSTVMDCLRRELSAEELKVEVGHWRPAILDLGSGDDEALKAAEDPHGREPRSPLGSVAKLGWIGLNWWIGWFLHLRKAARGGVLLFDRYHGDLLVDPRRYRYGGPAWLAAWWSSMLPQPDRVVFLDADEEVLLGRKQEVSKEALKSSRARYTALVEGLACGRVVDASGPVEQVVMNVRQLIEECGSDER